MNRYSDIDPQDLDPATGRPYSNYSSPALDTSFHDHEMDVEDRAPVYANAYEETAAAIELGKATAHCLWISIGEENARDGYALKPMPWEGPGSYQRVHFADGRDGLIRIPDLKPSFPTDWGKRHP